MRALAGESQRPLSVKALTNGIHSLGLLRANEIEAIAPKRKRNTPDEDLWAAARGGDCCQLRAAIQHGASVDAQDAQGVTALMIAATLTAGHEAVKLLIQNKADITLCSEKGVTALMYAAANDNHESLDALLTAADVDAEDVQGNTALLAAARYGYTDCVHFLLEHDAEPNHGNGGGVTALMQAAMRGHAKCLPELFQFKADPNLKATNGMFALILAAKNNHSECVQLLLTNKADPNLQATNGMFALVFAAKNNHSECVQLLLTNKADPNLRTLHQSTALMISAQYGHLSSLNALLDGEAKVDCKNEDGFTALMFGSWKGHSACVQALLAKGADPTLTNNFGNTMNSSLKLATLSKHQPCIDLLTAAIDAKDNYDDAVLEQERELANEGGQLLARLCSQLNAEQKEELEHLVAIERRRVELLRPYANAHLGEHTCPICLVPKKSLGFANQCGHRVCKRCFQRCRHCPICRGEADNPIQIFTSVRGTQCPPH